jgi:hypothetical protein
MGPTVRCLGTFCAALSNVDFEIGNGNAGAVAVRFHAAQYAYLAHIDFHIGSGLAGIHDVGNEGVDLHFYGGRYGILTKKPSPAWQYTLLDSTFEGQREAAIRENEAGLTLVHDEFKNVPTAVSIDAGYSDELWLKNVRFENGKRGRCYLQPCTGVRTVPRKRQQLAGMGDMYRVKAFSHGLTLAGLGAKGEIKTSFNAEPLKSLPAAVPNAIAALPAAYEYVTTRKLYQYVSPDRSLFIPADEVVVQGEPYFGAKFSYILQAYGLVNAAPGRPFYVTNESEQKTYNGTVNADGTLSDLQLFLNQGGENIAQDADGNIYLAAGQIRANQATRMRIKVRSSCCGASAIQTFNSSRIFAAIS